MAFASGTETVEVSRKLYVGVAPVYVLAVNPSKNKLDEIYGRESKEDPNYVGTTEVNGTTMSQVRIDFIVKTDSSKCDGIELINKISFFLTKANRYNKDHTKVEVINKYGETTWLPVECVEKDAPIPDNMKWYYAADIRPTFIGEADLTDFIKKYLNIPNKSYRNPNTGETVFIDDMTRAEARLDKIADYFTGDFSELNTIIALQPNNRVKCAFGVRTTDDNKQYQTVFTNLFVKMANTDYSKLDERIKDRQNNGAYPNVQFSVEPLHEYKVEATPFDAPVNNVKCPWDE